MNKEAQNLNNILKSESKAIYNLLSKKGKEIYFPKGGIIAQTQAAKNTNINATIGMACFDDYSSMRLQSITSLIDLESKDIFPYTSSFGKKELRTIWKEYIYKKNPSLKTETSLPIVTNALTHGLSMASYLFIDPNDKIIVNDKFWGNYKLIFENEYFGVLDTFNTFENNSFDLNSLKIKLSQGSGKKILILNFPNNPSGYTLTKEEVKKVTSILLDSANSGNNIIVILDDAYFGLVYKDNVFKESLFAKIADLHKNILAIKIDGISKEDYAWGLRIGFITFASKGLNSSGLEILENKTAGAIRGNISNVSHLSQSLILKAFNSENYEKEKKENYEILKSRFEEVERILKNDKYKKHFSTLPYNSGYFMCVELNEKLDANEIREILLEKYNTGLISINNLLRIAYSAVPKNKLQELFENIYKACEENI